MNINPKVSDLENHQTKIEVNIPYDEFEKEFEKQLNDYSKLAQIPGFRKGKIPRSIMINKFSSSIKNETLKRVINHTVKEINNDKKINIYGGLTITNEKIEYPDNEPLLLTLTAYKKPSCTIKKYEGLSFAENKKVIKEDHYLALKNNILERQGELKEVENDTVKIKDLITINLELLEKEEQKEKLDLLSLKDHIFYFSAPEKGALPDYLNYLYKDIIKLKKGVSQVVEITFPEAVNESSLKGSKVKLKLTITKIKRIKKAELNETLMKKMNYENVETFEKKIRENLDYLVEAKIREKKEFSILKAIKSETEFNIPEIFYQNSSQISWERQKEKYPKGSLPHTPPPEWEERFREEIKERLENELIINEIKKKYEINTGEEEMKKEIEKLSQAAKKDIKEFRREIIKSGDYTKIKENLIINKVFELLYSKNKVVLDKEFPVETLLEN